MTEEKKGKVKVYRKLTKPYIQELLEVSEISTVAQRNEIATGFYEEVLLTGSTVPFYGYVLHWLEMTSQVEIYHADTYYALCYRVAMILRSRYGVVVVVKK